MRYLINARLKPGREIALLDAINNGTLGRGSVAGDEYRHDMEQARIRDDGTVQWVEVCFCTTPLQEERLYWEEFFEILTLRDAHARRSCRDWNGTEHWACCACDCTSRLEGDLKQRGKSFLKTLRKTACTARHDDSKKSC